MTKKKQIAFVPHWQSMFNALRFVHNPVPIIRSAVEKYGPSYFFHMGGLKKVLLTQDEALITHILQKNHRNYQKSSIQTDILGAYLGKGLLTNNGDSWLKQRRLIQPSFHKSKIEGLAHLMEVECMSVMDKHIENGKAVFLQDFSALLTFHIIARAIFHKDLKEEDILVLRDRIQQIQHMVMLEVRQPYLRWYYRWTGRRRRHLQMAGASRQLLQRVIMDRRDSKPGSDLLQFLLDVRYEDDGRPMSDEQLIDELLILITAGHETGAHALTWTLLLLNHHPKHLQRARKEIEKKKCDYFSYFEANSYLLAIINESLRLYPPAWVTDRVALEEDHLGDIKIEKGMMIMLYLYGAHHDKSYWKEAETFHPSRFIHDPQPAAFFPFGAGPRLCIGRHFAYLELIIVLVNLLSRYDLPSTPIPFPDYQPKITLQPRQKVSIEFVSRNEPINT